MKKFLLLLFGVTMLVGCDNASYNIAEDQQNSNLPRTRVYALGQSLEYTGTRGYAWPYDSGEGWETARFSIRADNTAPDFYDHSSTYYYGRPAGKDGKNRGRVYTSYPYSHYNDRDYDYYTGKKTNTNIGLFRYVFDKKGLKTQLAIAEAPLVVDILDDEKVDLEAAIAANKDVVVNQAKLDHVNSLLAKGSDYLESHVLWYVVKEVATIQRWHVNGIIAETEPGEPDMKKIPDELEIDIHQQEHLDWNEIKTSVHIRTDVEALEINIPLAPEDIVEQDDFDIRVYTSYYKEYAEVNYTVTHDSKGITIRIDNINPSMINELMETYGDGLTVEIFSYTTANSEIWDKIKKSTVKVKKACNVSGQITSAFNDEKVQVYAHKDILN